MQSCSSEYGKESLWRHTAVRPVRTLSSPSLPFQFSINYPVLSACVDSISLTPTRTRVILDGENAPDNYINANYIKVSCAYFAFAIPTSLLTLLWFVPSLGPTTWISGVHRLPGTNGQHCGWLLAHGRPGAKDDCPAGRCFILTCYCTGSFFRFFVFIYLFIFPVHFWFWKHLSTNSRISYMHLSKLQTECSIEHAWLLWWPGLARAGAQSVPNIGQMLAVL